MKLFLDSGNIREIQEVVELLNIDGITTNPKLSTTENAIRIATTVKLITSIQIEYRNHEEAVREAKRVQTPWSIIKIPVSDLKLGKRLINTGFKVNFTLCFDLHQLICASNLGADYVSVFVGRLLDNGVDVNDFLKRSVEYLERSRSRTKLIAASIRTSEHLEMVASLGCHIATIPPRLILDYKNSMTEAGLKDFEENKVIFDPMRDNNR